MTPGTYHSSPVGTWLATWQNDVLTKLEFLGKQLDNNSRELTPHVQMLDMQLQQFFAGKHPTFSVPYVVNGTPFQRAVWRELEKIPMGSTTTYGEIAQKIGRPKAVRAVGTAVGNNPIALLVGCHRVLGKHSLGGYAFGLKLKEHLLNLEQKKI